jgi:DNA polymerase-3 subunit beta
MKIIVSKQALEVCVKNLCRVINTKNALPILADILFDVNEQEKVATLTASDGEVRLTYAIGLKECFGGGRFCVVGQTLADMLSGISEQPVTIIATIESDMKFTLNYEDGEAYCPIENADEYPEAIGPDENEGNMVTLDSATVSNAIKRSAWATAKDELRIVMNGIYFDFGMTFYNIVASDGHVLIKNKIQFDEENDMAGSFIMPKKVVKILPELLTTADDGIDILYDDRKAAIEYENMRLQFLLIEGKYPNYDSIIPKASAHEVKCARRLLLEAIKAVAPFAPDSSNMVTLTFEKDKLDARGNDYDFSEGAKKSFYIDGYEGDPLTIGVKASNMISLLSKLSTDDVLLKLNDPSHAIVVEPVDERQEKTEEITCIIMPMIVGE